MPNVAVVLNTRNECDLLDNSLNSILNQNLLPYRIIVINDGSTDKTKESLEKFENIEVINTPTRTESHLGRKELAQTINLGLKRLHDDNKCEYVWLSGGDLVYPTNYLSEITKRMKKDSSVISSGIVEGEFSIEPRGGGRVVDWKFWKKIGRLYPENYGWEGYLVWKALSMGYNSTSHSDLLIKTQRKTGSKFNPQTYYYYGLALKALGYAFTYTIMKVLLFAKRRPRAAFYILKGYLSNYDQLYEKELRDFIRDTQSSNKFSKKYAQRFFKILRS